MLLCYAQNVALDQFAFVPLVNSCAAFGPDVVQREAKTQLAFIFR